MFKKSLLVLLALGVCTILSAGVNDKTVVKNSTLETNVQAQNIDVKGKLNLGSVKVGKGSTIENSQIRSNTNVGNVKVDKGGEASVGGVEIGK